MRRIGRKKERLRTERKDRNEEEEGRKERRKKEIGHNRGQKERLISKIQGDKERNKRRDITKEGNVTIERKKEMDLERTDDKINRLRKEGKYRKEIRRRRETKQN